MIKCKAPFRISYFGGGTDFPEYFKKKNCIIIGGTIDKYIYISLNNYYSNLFDHKIKLFYNMLEFVNSIKSIVKFIFLFTAYLGVYPQLFKRIIIKKIGINFFILIII